MNFEKEKPGNPKRLYFSVGKISTAKHGGCLLLLKIPLRE
jgi:hypothetical protein